MLFILVKAIAWIISVQADGIAVESQLIIQQFDVYTPNSTTRKLFSAYSYTWTNLAGLVV